MPDDGLRSEVVIDPAIEAVEIKVTARVSQEDEALELLKSTGEEPETRTIYFFDTPELDLFDKGLVLRARKVRGDEDDSTVKLRPIDPATIPIDWSRTDGFEIEMDRVGDREVISAKLSAAQAPGEIDAAVSGERPLRKLFSKDQERLIEEFGPADVGWDTLTVMGPIDVQKWKVDFPGFPHDVVAERWILPDGSDLVELSITVRPGEAADTTTDFSEFLAKHGLDVDGDQQTKTKGALAFFTAGKSFD